MKLFLSTALIVLICILSGCSNNKELDNMCESRVRLADDIQLRYVCLNNKLTIIKLTASFFDASQMTILEQGDFCECKNNEVAR